jgi:hypothetical protein
VNCATDAPLKDDDASNVGGGSKGLYSLMIDAVESGGYYLIYQSPEGYRISGNTAAAATSFAAAAAAAASSYVAAVCFCHCLLLLSLLLSLQLLLLLSLLLLLLLSLLLGPGGRTGNYHCHDNPIAHVAIKITPRCRATRNNQQKWEAIATVEERG